MSVKVFDDELLSKRDRLIELGQDPYPYRFEITSNLKQIRAQSEQLMGQAVTVAGRLSSTRKMGKARFLTPIN